MKRAAPWVFLGFFNLLGAALLLQMHRSGEQTFLVHQSSEYAIIDLTGEEAQGWFDQGKLKISTPGSHSKTLIRVQSGGPFRIAGKLESNGEILLINPAGIIVGPSAMIDLPKIESTLNPRIPSRKEPSAEQPNSVELIHHGNVYALAVHQGGQIRATRKQPSGGQFLLDSNRDPGDSVNLAIPPIPPTSAPDR